MSEFDKSLDTYIANYDNLLLLYDFNSEITDENMNEFCDGYISKNLIKEATCFKGLHNHTSVDVIPTNRSKQFQDSRTIETGISGHHKLRITLFKRLDPVKLSIGSTNILIYHPFDLI